MLSVQPWLVCNEKLVKHSEQCDAIYFPARACIAGRSGQWLSASLRLWNSLECAGSPCVQVRWTKGLLFVLLPGHELPVSLPGTLSVWLRCWGKETSKGLKRLKTAGPVCSMIERRPMNQEVTSSILVRAHAWVVRSVPSRGCVGGSLSMFLFLYPFLFSL